MKTILFPTDFSKTAGNAMKYALEVAKRMDAKIIALYVVYPSRGVDDNFYDAFIIDDYVKERKKAMTTWARRFKRREDFKNIIIETECRIGFPVSMISHTAAEFDVDLIVMGTTGAAGLSGVLLGSTAGGVLTGSRYPVLVVPKNAKFRDDARFALATDFKMQLDSRSMHALKSLLGKKPAALEVVHVTDDPEGKAKKGEETALGKKLDSLPHTFHYIHDKNVPRAISVFLQSINANGLVTIAHEHSLLQKLFSKSVSRSLAHHTTVPMLVLHG